MAEDNENEGSKGSGLRAQLEAALEEIQTLKSQVEQGSTAQRDLAFMRAGIDPTEGVGKLLAKTYDGDLEAEAIQAFAEEYGVAGESAPAPRQDQTQQRMDKLRSASQPEGAAGQRMSHAEFLELSKVDPAAARQAHASGLIDMPPQMAQQLDANRNTVRLG